MVYNIKKSEELFKLKLSVVCAHGIETHSVSGVEVKAGKWSSNLKDSSMLRGIHK